MSCECLVSSCLPGCSCPASTDCRPAPLSSQTRNKSEHNYFTQFWPNFSSYTRVVCPTSPLNELLLSNARPEDKACNLSCYEMIDPVLTLVWSQLGVPACVNNFQITALLTLMSTLIIFNSILLIITRLRAQAGSGNASLYFLPELENFDR